MFVDPLRGLQHNQQVLIERSRSVEIPPQVLGDPPSCPARTVAITLGNVQAVSDVEPGPEDVITLDGDPRRATQHQSRSVSLA
jgi:hypothetical protein